MKEQFKLYERFEREVTPATDKVILTYENGVSETVYPFMYQPINIEYDDEGIETVTADGKPYKMIRFTPKYLGKIQIAFFEGYTEISKEESEVMPSESHGYVKISERDRRYFEYTDGTSFVPVGINMAFPGTFEATSGSEFGLAGKFNYIGLRQYERWFKKAAKNGVNMVRVWLGHPYFTADTENAYELDYVNLSKSDALVKMASSYGLKLMLTFDNFRYFDYDRVADTNSYSDDVFRKFNKRLYLDGKRCESVEEWVNDEKWAKAWLYKVGEIAKRYADDANIFAFELWNEMDCIRCAKEDKEKWNAKYLPKVASMFPNSLVTNSNGSFFNDFPWQDESTFKQLHIYIDQGAKYEIWHGDPVDIMTDAFGVYGSDSHPLLIAETGAVQNCHTGPFKFYVNDDDGLIFADCVYTPVFLGGAGCGNIWHWDERYVESKNLYHMFKPIAALTEGIDMPSEDFKSIDLSTDEAHILILKGKHNVLGYIRNKSASWQNILRDLGEVTPIKELCIKAEGIRNVQSLNIWEETAARVSSDAVTFENIRFGLMFRGEL